MHVVFNEKHVPETNHKDGELGDVSGDDEVVSNGGPAVLLEEHHQEAKTDIDHDVNILEEGVVLLDLVFLHQVVDFFNRISKGFSKLSVDSNDVGCLGGRVHTFTVLCAESIENNHDDF